MCSTVTNWFFPLKKSPEGAKIGVSCIHLMETRERERERESSEVKVREGERVRECVCGKRSPEISPLWIFSHKNHISLRWLEVRKIKWVRRGISKIIQWSQKVFQTWEFPVRDVKHIDWLKWNTKSISCYINSSSLITTD